VEYFKHYLSSSRQEEACIKRQTEEITYKLQRWRKVAQDSLNIILAAFFIIFWLCNKLQIMDERRRKKQTKATFQTLYYSGLYFLRSVEKNMIKKAMLQFKS
jgi:hypothetical protein